MIGVQQYLYVYDWSTRVWEQQQQEYTEQQQEYKSMGVYAVVQYAMSTVTTVPTRVLVAGVYKSTAVYAAESIAVVCQVSTEYSSSMAQHTEAQLYIICMYYILTMYNSILHRISSSIYTAAYLYNCITVSVRGFKCMQV